MKIVSATASPLRISSGSNCARGGYHAPRRFECRVVPAIEAVQIANGLRAPPLALRCWTHRSALSALAEPNRLRIVRRNWPFRDAIGFLLIRPGPSDPARQGSPRGPRADSAARRAGAR